VDLFPQLFDVDVGLFVTTQSALEFLLQRPGVLQHRTDVGPHSGVKSVQADGLVLANFRATEASSIHSDAPVVRVRGLIVLTEASDPFAIPAVAAAAANHQPLQQISGTLYLLSMPLAILCNLFGNGVKQL
jgi:hypothetical protein